MGSIISNVCSNHGFYNELTSNYHFYYRKQLKIKKIRLMSGSCHIRRVEIVGNDVIVIICPNLHDIISFLRQSYTYVPSTLNIDLIMWHTQLTVCAENVKSWFKSWVFPFTFQAYILPHTLNCICISLFKFYI
jgi:hypothetical protein